MSASPDYLSKAERSRDFLSPERDTRALVVLLLIGVILAAPALQTPFFLDDYLHAAMVQDTFPAHRGALNLYAFVDDSSRDALLSRGLLPWWVSPHVTIRFLRPLSSALLYVDHRVFGSHPFPMHLHSLAWWMAAVLSARALFRRVFDSRRVAFFATAVFALAACHAVPLAWLANREVIVAVTFGALALRSYLRFREARAGSGMRDAIVTTIFFALALMAGGEYSIAFGGYVVAYDLVRENKGDRGSQLSIGARVLAWLPFVVPAIAYLAIRSALHYGAHGSGFYSDPFVDSARFFGKLPGRLVTLIADAWLTLDTVSWTAEWQRWAAVAIVILAAIVARWMVRHALDAFTREEARRVKWLIFGSILSLAPLLAVVPSTRLLEVAMLGVAPTVAILLERAWFRADEDAREKTSWFGVGASLLAFAHLIHGPSTLWLDSHQIRVDAAELAWRAAAIEGRVQTNNANAASGATIGLVRGTAGMYFAPFALDDSHRAPAMWRILAQARHVLIKRIDEKTIELVGTDEVGLYPEGDLNLYRPEDEPIAAGAEITVPGLHVKVLELGKRGPRRARLTFDENPDSFTWLDDNRGGMNDAELPQIGFGKPFDYNSK